jgi:chromosome segregation ATPase
MSTEDVLKRIAGLKAERDAAIAENADLRRQLAEAQEARLAEVAMSVSANLALHRNTEEAATLLRQLAHMTQWRDSALVDGNEARAEAADLRRQLAEARAQLANSVLLPPPICGDRGMAGRSPCHLPAKHDGPHEYRTYIEADEEAMRRLSLR